MEHEFAEHAERASVPRPRDLSAHLCCMRGLTRLCREREDPILFTYKVGLLMENLALYISCPIWRKPRHRGIAEPAERPSALCLTENTGLTTAHLAHVLLAGEHQLMVDDPVRLPLEERATGVDKYLCLLHHRLVALHA